MIARDMVKSAATLRPRAVFWTAIFVLVFACSHLMLAAPAALGQAADQSAESKAGVSRVQALSRRVEQLEEQIVDLQVVIGTLESLAKSGARSGGAAYSGGGANVGTLETQIKALSAQVSQLSADVRALQSGQRGGFAGSDQYAPQAQGGAAQQFGATTVRPAENNDAIGNLITEVGPGGEPGAAAAPQVAEQSGPKALYEGAYSHLLQQDYASAQAGFRKFLRQYPEHGLVPNALYWLGETYYVQQNYADAAEAFDIVTAAYGTSNKAPDSQLKRAMSLANLGKRSEACSAFRTLAKRFPNAPDHVKSKADSERQRVGCT